MNSPTYRIDRAALREAEAYLGLKLRSSVWRVHINRLGGAAGRYCYAWDYGYHWIKLNKDADFEWASKSIWHELRHAEQFERNGSCYWCFMKEYDQQGEAPEDEFTQEWWDWYNQCPYEQEAVATEANHDWLPLTLPLE